jgi:hypothetical protein
VHRYWLNIAFPTRLVNIKRRSTSWQSEQLKVWCSKPGTVMVSSGTTFIKIISAPQAIQRIGRATLTYQRRSSVLIVCHVS